MIIGPDFIWLNFPKCVDGSVELALRELLIDRPSMSFDEIDDRSGYWHETILQRKQRDPSFNPAGRRIISCIRRLPHWILARVHFEAKRTGQIATREMILQGKFHEPSGEVFNADMYMRLYLPVDRWLRSERLTEDISDFLDLKKAAVFSALFKQARGTTDYVGDLSFWFTPSDLDRLYEANPLWAKTEYQAYGDTLTTGLWRNPMKARRESLGLSAEDLADKMRIPVELIVRIEAQDHDLAHLTMAKLIWQELGYPSE